MFRLLQKKEVGQTATLNFSIVKKGSNKFNPSKINSYPLKLNRECFSKTNNNVKYISKYESSC